MSKFDERAMRMRREQIDLFGNKSLIVVMSRPGRRSLAYPVVKVAEAVSREKQTPTCMNRACSNEVREVDTFFAVVRSGSPLTIFQFACPACAAKSDAELLSIVRDGLSAHADIGQPNIEDGYTFEVKGEQATVRGIRIFDVGDGPSVAADTFKSLLADGLLPFFEFNHPTGCRNCFAINSWLFRDLKAAGYLDRITFWRGNSKRLRPDGEPVGPHYWAELDGSVIDGANGSYNPVLIQRREDYLREREMADIEPAVFEIAKAA